MQEISSSALQKDNAGCHLKDSLRRLNMMWMNESIHRQEKKEGETESCIQVLRSRRYEPVGSFSVVTVDPPYRIPSAAHVGPLKPLIYAEL